MFSGCLKPLRQPETQSDNPNLKGVPMPSTPNSKNAGTSIPHWKTCFPPRKTCPSPPSAQPKTGCWTFAASNWTAGWTKTTRKPTNCPFPCTAPISAAQRGRASPSAPPRTTTKSATSPTAYSTRANSTTAWHTVWKTSATARSMPACSNTASISTPSKTAPSQA